jgi:rod shape-determining protein MreC
VKRFENKDITADAVVEPAVDFSILEHVFTLEVPTEETPLKK